MAAVGAVVVAVVADLPRLGAGVSYRPEWRWEAVRHRGRLGCLELIADELSGPEALRQARLLDAAVPVLLHGIGLSLGSAEGLDPWRLDQLASVVEALRPPWLSEHIAFTRAGGVEIGHLTPLPFTAEAVETVSRNVAQLRATLPGMPLLLENIAYTVRLPGAEMDEATFVRRVIESADTGLLLDLENVHANALNHDYQPEAFLSALPLERVVEVHLAGGVWSEAGYADTHSRPVPEASWSLLEWLLARVPVHAVIIERDNDLPDFPELLAEVERASRMLAAA